MARIVIAPQYGTPDVLTLVDSEIGAPGSGDVAIAVKAAGVNPADAKALAGMFGRDESALPLRVGSEVAGVITAVGSDTEFAVGDEVVAFRVAGGYASDIVAPASAVFPKPAELGWNEAAGLLLAGVTAWHLVEATQVVSGDVVIVHGASGAVGALAVQLARMRGAQVVGTASESRQGVVAELGATPVAYGPGLADRLRALLPDGATVALDATGTDEALDASVELVADRSRIATIAGYQRGAELGVLRLGNAPGADPGYALRDAARSEIIRLAAAGDLRVSIATTFPLEQAADALRLVAGGHAGGKVVLIP